MSSSFALAVAGPQPGFQSCRKATAGSTWSARRAGIWQASNATRINTTGATVIVTGYHRGDNAAIRRRIIRFQATVDCFDLGASVLQGCTISQAAHCGEALRRD